MIRFVLELLGLRPPRPPPTPWHKRNRPVTPPEQPLRTLIGTRRRLTDPSIEEHHFHPQRQSALLSRIPIELRLIIWEYAIGPEHENDVLHLEPADGILRYCRCYEKDHTKLPFRHLCWKAIWTKELRDQNMWDSSEPTKTRKIRSLLLTCGMV